MAELLLNRDVGFQRLLIALDKSLQIIEKEKLTMHPRDLKPLKNAFESVNNTITPLLCEIRTVLGSLSVAVPIVKQPEISDFFSRDSDLGFYNYIVLRESVNSLKFMNAAVGTILNGIHSNN